MGRRPQFQEADIAIADAINSRTAEDPDYWSFRGRAQRDAAHALFQYPAMMVPKMQGELIDIVRSAYPEIRRVWDPFVGSGTILIESMSRGLNFFGCDINPLAILACMAKVGPYDSVYFKERCDTLLARIKSDKGRRYAVNFVGQSKWFSKGATERLSKIRRAIELECHTGFRRMFWLTFAETIRRTSNSRTSTYKLHIKAKAELENYFCDPLEFFEELLKSARKCFSEQEDILNANRVLRNGSYIHDVRLLLEDVNHLHANTAANQPQFDLVVTSPPYGDNASTVPYGQFSYLPSQWIPYSEFGTSTITNAFSTTHTLDSASLGGSNVAGLERGDGVAEISASFRECFDEVRAKNKQHGQKLGSFGFDLFLSISSIAERVRPGGILIWTLGNRRVSTREIPLATIVEEMLAYVGATTIMSFERNIPSKRMAVRNNVSGTMRKETVLIMRMG